MVLSVKNMVCNRCITIVTSVFKDTGISPTRITLGEVETDTGISAKQIDQLNAKLSEHGFEIIENAKARLIEKIKNLVIDDIYKSERKRKFNYSVIISEKLHKEYSYLSNLFSEKEGITIEKYIILQKIERVKELLVYDELSLSQIADDLGYSSVAHLSGQFKKITGLTPGYFKSLKIKKRSTLDDVVSKNDIKSTKSNVIRRKDNDGIL